MRQRKYFRLYAQMFPRAGVQPAVTHLTQVLVPEPEWIPYEICSSWLNKVATEKNWLLKIVLWPLHVFCPRTSYPRLAVPQASGTFSCLPSHVATEVLGLEMCVAPPVVRVCFEIVCHYIALASVEPLRSACLFLSCAGIRGIRHHTRLANVWFCFVFIV